MGFTLGFRVHISTPPLTCPFLVHHELPLLALTGPLSSFTGPALLSSAPSSSTSPLQPVTPASTLTPPADLFRFLIYPSTQIPLSFQPLHLLVLSSPHLPL